MQEEFNQLPQIDSRLRKNILRMPEAVFQASGIVINGRRIKSFVFTTDLAIIRNCDADAVFAVYPFTPQQAISDAIIKASYIPVFCGVGGGTTKGMRTVSLAKDVESQGAMGVVLNAPISDLNLLAVSKAVDIPVIATVTREDTDIAMRLESVDSEHCLRLQNAGGCAQNPGAIPAGAPDRLRRQDERNRPRNNSCRSQRDYLHAALRAGSVQNHHGSLSGIAGANDCRFLHAAACRAVNFPLQRLFYIVDLFLRNVPMPGHTAGFSLHSYALLVER